MKKIVCVCVCLHGVKRTSILVCRKCWSLMVKNLVGPLVIEVRKAESE